MKNWIIGILVVVIVALGAWLVIGQGTPITKTKTIALTVTAQEGSFNIVSHDAIQVKAGENVGFTIDVQPLLGFSRPVKFTLSGGPPGMVVSWEGADDTWDPGQGNLQCNLTVPLDNGLVGQYSLTLTGTSQ